MHNAAKKTRQEVYRYTGDHEEWATTHLLLQDDVVTKILEAT
jgi:hypothetical protein